MDIVENSEPIRVLRIMHRMNIGGPTHHASYLTKYLDKEFETMLISGLITEGEQDGSFIMESIGIKPVYIKDMKRSINPFQDIKALFAIKAIINQYKPTIVHTHAAKSGTLGRIAALWAGVPIIIHTFHGHVFHSYFGWFKTNLFLKIERFLAKKSTKIIAISEAQKRELVEDFKIAPADKFTVIPLGFDLSKFQENYIEKRQIFRIQYNLTDDTVAIGIIGRVTAIKNVSMFIQAVRFLLDNTHIPFKAFIVGDGDLRHAIEKEANDLNIPFSTEKSDKHPYPLVFTSWRTDIDIINAGLDIVALTSLNEGTPVSLIEAQAANNPIVATEVGGIRDIVIENETALLCSTKDTEKFSNQLLSLIENKELRLSLGKKGFEHVFNKFHYTRLVNDIRLLYLKLVSEHTQNKKS